jgi:accessory gene regulator protein AgrB
MSLGLFTAIVWFIVYSQMGSKHLLAVACMFLISPVLFAEAYAKAEMPDLLRTKAKKKK